MHARITLRAVMPPSPPVGLMPSQSFVALTQRAPACRRRVGHTKWPHRFRRATLGLAGALAVVAMSANPAGAQTSPTVEWVDGADAYEVAVAAIGGDCASLAGDAGHVHLALATGENWPDALAASALDRPLLLSGPATLHSATRRFVEGCTGKVGTVISSV